MQPTIASTDIRRARHVIAFSKNIVICQNEQLLENNLDNIKRTHTELNAKNENYKQDSIDKQDFVILRNDCNNTIVLAFFQTIEKKRQKVFS